MSQSKISQVCVDEEYEGIVIRFAYPSFDANVSSTSQKYNHSITLEQTRYIRDKLNKILDEEEIHSKLMNYDLCHHCPFMTRVKSIIKDYDSSEQTMTEPHKQPECPNSPTGNHIAHYTGQCPCCGYNSLSETKNEEKVI